MTFFSPDSVMHNLHLNYLPKQKKDGPVPVLRCAPEAAVEADISISGKCHFLFEVARGEYITAFWNTNSLGKIENSS